MDTHIRPLALGMDQALSGKTLLTGVKASAGAKVMLTGGYLVLEQDNSATVVSVNARMHSSVFPLGKSFKKVVLEDGQSARVVPIVVMTPQRTTEPLVLELVIASPSHMKLSGPALTANPFVSTTLKHAFQAIAYAYRHDFETGFFSRISSGLLIHIRGDRAFYSSQPASNIPDTVPESLAKQLPTFIKLEPNENDDPKDYTNKTGLGSSAALVSSLISALFAHFGLLKLRLPGFPASSDEKFEQLRTFAYRVAQVAHCDAQGKVGSGFDIAVAFYGTQEYSRFSPDLIAPLLGRDSIPMDEFAEIMASDLPAIYGEQTASQEVAEGASSKSRRWDDTTKAFIFPPGFKLLLGDVHGGSETPGMVKQILAWKASDDSKENAEPTLSNEIPSQPKALWSSLGFANSEVAKCLEQLAASVGDGVSYYKALRRCATLAPEAWAITETDKELHQDETAKKVVNLLIKLRADFLKVRARLRAMGEASKVPVEPESQTKLLDSLMTQDDHGTPGVLMAGVPGAGGYDAVFAVILDPDNLGQENPATNHVLNMWANAQATVGCVVHQLPVAIDEGGILCEPTARLFSVDDLIKIPFGDLSPNEEAEHASTDEASANTTCQLLASSKKYLPMVAVGAALVALTYGAVKLLSRRK